MKDTICWNCKSCTGNPDYPCPWAQDGKPVPGWTAEKGKMFRFPVPKKDGTMGYTMEQSYVVVDCPLYQRDKKFGTVQDIITAIAPVVGVSEKTVALRRYYYFEKYERLTGEELPVWAWKFDENDLSEV